MRGAIVAFVALALGGCLALGGLDDYRLGSTSAGGAGGSANVGGGGNNGGNGGNCDAASPGACLGLAVNTIGGPTGNIEVTDVAFDDDQGAVVVGRFSGTVQFDDTSLTATNGGTDGFMFVGKPAPDVGPLQLTELSAESEIVVGFDEGMVAIAATYHDTTTGCPGSRGIMVWLAEWDGATFQTVSSCVEAQDTTTVHLTGIAVDRTATLVGVANISGSFEGGTLGTSAAANGVDGFVVEIVNTMPFPTVFGGDGDQVVQGIVYNPEGQWLVAGDFDNSLVITFGPESYSFPGAANGTRHLFVATMDRAPGDENLDVQVMTGGHHRVTDLSLPDPTLNPRGAALSARLSGPLEIDGAEVVPASAYPEANLVLEFIAPYDPTRAFAVRRHFVLEGDSVAVDSVVYAGVDLIYAAGAATGDVVVRGSSISERAFPAVTCAREAFILGLAANGLAPMQRCGDGQQTLVGLSPKTPNGVTAAFNLPVGGVLDLGRAHTPDGGNRAYLLFVPGP